MGQMTIVDALRLAAGHYQAGRTQEGEQLCRQILSFEPGNADAVEMLGLLAMRSGRPAEAAELVRKAIALRPGHPRYHHDLGLILCSSGQHDAAIECFRQAISIRPDYVEAHSNLGATLRRRLRLDEAIAAYERAVSIQPAFAEAHYNLGNVLKDRGRLDDAVESFRKAIAIKPDFAEALCNLGTVLKDTGQVEEAVTLQRRAEQLKPDPSIGSCLLCTMQFDPAQDLATILAEHARWDRTYAQPLAREARPHGNDRSPERKLRIGYVSPDLCLHPVSYCLMPVLRNHDRAAFEVYCYCDVEHPDPVTAEFRGLADVWRHTFPLGHAQLAELVRADGIDVLIDLAGHSNGNRLMAFARRPAPVQIDYLGWPGTTGMSAMDYRVGDRFIDHPHAVFAEKTLCMPDSFWCYDPGTVDARPNELPARSAGYVTFGCTNNFAKISGLTLGLWARALTQVPGSRLLLRAPTENARRRVLDRLAAGGVDPARVEFAAKLPRQQYWEFYNRIDINLDATPYNGHVTTMDSLYMGVPMVSLAGGMPLARAGYSILSNVGLAELVAHDADGYVRTAVALADDPDRAAALRASLRDRIRASPLMDARRYTRNWEAHVRECWRAWCAAQSSPPSSAASAESSFASNVDRPADNADRVAQRPIHRAI